MYSVFKKTKTWTGFALVAAIGFTTLSFAKDIGKYEILEPRANDTDVEAYIRNKETGELKRARQGASVSSLSSVEESFNKGCAVTTKATDMKGSQHPNDEATAYFIKEGNLHFISKRQERVPARGNCPAAKTGQLTSGAAIKEYGVISNTDTEIVNWSLQKDGTFKAWDNRIQRSMIAGVKDVSSVQCFGQRGMPFSKKILLLQTFDGTIKTLETDGDIKTEQGSYRDIKEFRKKRQVCGETDRADLPSEEVGGEEAGSAAG